MKGLGRKASLLALMAVIATALLGSAYSLWYEDLTVTTNISTTSLDASIACLRPADNELADWPAPAAGPIFAAYPVGSPLKDVANASIVSQPDLHRIELLIGNAYPGYAWDCELHVFNKAPLPWHLEDIRISVQQCDADGEHCVPLVPPPATWITTCQFGVCSWGDLGVNPPTYPAGLSSWSPLFVGVTNWEGCQLHQENFFGLSGSFFVGVNQSAQQNVRYKLVVDYQVNQWNESSYSGCGQLRPGATGPMLSQLQ